MPAIPHTSRDDLPFRDIERRLRALEAVYVNPDTAASAYDLLPKSAMRQVARDTSSGLLGVTTVIPDMLISDVSVVAGRMYGFHFHGLGLFNVNTATARWLLRLQVNAANVGSFMDFQTITAGANQRREIDAWVFWYPTVTASTDDIRLVADEVANDAAFQIQASAADLRVLTMFDMGVAPVRET